jgi:hypothetical protein
VLFRALCNIEITTFNAELAEMLIKDFSAISAVSALIVVGNG